MSCWNFTAFCEVSSASSMVSLVSSAPIVSPVSVYSRAMPLPKKVADSLIPRISPIITPPGSS